MNDDDNVIPTNISELDTALKGGLRKGTLTAFGHKRGVNIEYLILYLIKKMHLDKIVPWLNLEEGYTSYRSDIVQSDHPPYITKGWLDHVQPGAPLTGTVLRSALEQAFTTEKQDGSSALGAFFVQGDRHLKLGHNPDDPFDRSRATLHTLRTMGLYMKIPIVVTPSKPTYVLNSFSNPWNAFNHEMAAVDAFFFIHSEKKDGTELSYEITRSKLRHPDRSSAVEVDFQIEFNLEELG